MKRWIFIAAAAIALIVIPHFTIESETHARVVSIAAICLLLWLSDAVPPFVPTLLLWLLIPLTLSGIDRRFDLPHVLTWAADPVMALFFGGFTIGAAAHATGLDKRLTETAIRFAGGSFAAFLILAIGTTAFLSMWMSNIAAAALVFSALKPILAEFDENSSLRRTVLIGVALGADLGGIATPVGTGPNAIAVASLPAGTVSFASWMAFALPLTIGMLALAFFLLYTRARNSSPEWNVAEIRPAEGGHPRKQQLAFAIILAITIGLWLTEPLHGIPSAVTALGASALLFGSGILSRKDLLEIDWSTLLLIAGGITLGRLLEQTNIVQGLSAIVPFGDLHPSISLFILCVAAATFSALMSNTATAVILIPLATAIIPSPTTPILIAVAASFGLPFVISTPPNAMAFGRGGVRFGDLFWPGVVLSLVGCALVSTTGRLVLEFAGIR
jgi:sodium-dependent dicarboxylate transporter 2/3/5